MADDADLAQTFNEQFLEEVLADHRRRQPAGESRTHCEDCHQPIPEDRREAAKGCTRCLPCQELIELHMNWSAL